MNTSEPGNADPCVPIEAAFKENRMKERTKDLIEFIFEDLNKAAGVILIAAAVFGAFFAYSKYYGG